MAIVVPCLLKSAKLLPVTGLKSLDSGEEYSKKYGCSLILFVESNKFTLLLLASLKYSLL